MDFLFSIDYLTDRIENHKHNNEMVRGNDLAMEEIVIYPKKGRMIVFAILSAFFILLGVLFVFLGVSEGEPWLMVFGLFFVILFSICFVLFIKSVVNPVPGLKITDEGIVQPTKNGFGLIKWEEIESVKILRFSSQKLLGIYTYDKGLIIDRSHGWQRFLHNLNRGLIDSQANIAIKNLDYSVDDLLDEIDLRMNQDTRDDSKATDLKS